MKRIIAVLAIMTLILFVIAGCGSDKKTGGISGQGGVTGAPDVVQKGDPVLAAASGYVGSERCGQCHGTIFTGWSKSLHNKPLKTVAELGESIFVNDADGNGVNDFKDGLDLSTTSAFASYGTNTAPKLSYSAGKYYITIGAVQYEVQRTQGGNGYWKQRYHTKIGNSYYILPVQYNEVSKTYTTYNPSHWYSGDTTPPITTPAPAPRFTEAYGSDALVSQFGALNTTSTSVPSANRQLGTARSWENRCAGCHQTGFTAEVRTFGTTTAKEVVSGYVELNIGCEACHGPGADHVNSGGNPSLITNPERLRTYGVSGLRIANLVCGQCHHRGEGKATFSGMSVNLEYPSRIVSGNLVLPLPGANFIGSSPADAYIAFNTTTAYYGYPTLSTSAGEGTFEFYTAYRTWYTVEGITFPTYIAAKQHHQQWTDMEQGPHAPDKDYDPTCWSCHDPHQGAGDHQIKDSIVEGGVTVATNNDDNTLCLACHATHGPFAGITPSDVASGAAAVGTAVLKHIGDEAAMNIASYAPATTPTTRCSRCHMPKTASSAITTKITTTTNIAEGDIHNHSFNIIWPSVNSNALFTALRTAGTATTTINDQLKNMPNSCFAVGCHSDSPTDPRPQYLHEITEWAESGHADFTGEPFRHWDADGVVSTSCAKCHTKSGFTDYAEDGSISSSTTFGLGNVLSCGACHVSGASGKTKYDDLVSYPALSVVTFPSGSTATLNNASNLCMACHQGRTSKFTVDNDIATAVTPTGLRFENIHYFAAAATFFGSDVHGGYEYGTYGTYAGQNTFGGNMPTRDTCIECHMDKGTTAGSTKHTFEPELSYCTGCHSVADFKDIRTSGTDYDGDGNTTEGIYNEIWDTLVPALLTAIRNYSTGTPAVFAANGNHGVVYSPTTYPYFLVDTDNDNVADSTETTGYVFDAKLLKAAYNYQVVQKEPCGYIHNAKYHIQLIRDSIQDLTGAAPAGTRP